MTLIDELKYRGFINQCTNEDDLIKLLNSEKLSFYIGFDCTAKSLHVGSLIQIMIMRIFQKYGHTPIILIGKGTTRIGDPSGKDETRKILSEEEINENAINLVEVFKKYLNFYSELMIFSILVFSSLANSASTKILPLNSSVIIFCLDAISICI